MGVRAAPSCAAAPAAAGAEQNRRPGLWPTSPPPLLLLLLLSLGLLHAGRRRPGGERAARALFWVPERHGPSGRARRSPSRAHGSNWRPAAAPGPARRRLRPPPATAASPIPACGGRVQDQRSGALLLSTGVLTGAAADRVSAALAACERRLEPCAAAAAAAALQLRVAARPGIAPGAKIFHPTLGWIPKELKVIRDFFRFCQGRFGSRVWRIEEVFEASLVFSVPSGLDR